MNNMNEPTTWLEELIQEADRHDDRHGDPITYSIAIDDLTRYLLSEENYHPGFAEALKNKPFYAWTKDRVYFTFQYDGATSVASVPRNPVRANPRHHIGGPY